MQKKKQTNISREPDQQPPRPAPETSAREREARTAKELQLLIRNVLNTNK